MSSSESNSYDSSGSSVSSDDTGYEDFSNFVDLEYKVIGNYHLIKMLGQGAYAQVWLAYNHVKDDFFALKVQHPDDFKSAKEELRILRSISKVPYKIEVVESFVFFLQEEKDNENNRYYVIVFPVYGSNVDELSRYSIFENGFGESIVKKFTRQTLENLVVLHNKYNLMHCDIKPDNFLLSEPNLKTKKIMEAYPVNKFKEVYKRLKEKNAKIISDKKSDMITREKLHRELVNDIDFESLSKLKENDDELLVMLKKSNFLISDFGNFCDIEEKYDEDFGTRYYRSPENILVSEDLNYSTDIWSLGCTIYELLTNKYLFNPSKCSKYSTDHYHLSSILQLGQFSNREIRSFGRKKEFFNKYKEPIKLPKSTQVIDKINKLESSFWKGFILSTLTVSFKKRPSSNTLLDMLKKNQ